MSTAIEVPFDTARRRFESTRNPLEVWDSYLSARRLGATIPEWMLDYFECVAQRIYTLQAFTPGEPFDKEKLRKLNAALPAALGFTTAGRGSSPWRRLEDRGRDCRIGIAIIKRLDKGTKAYIAREEVAEEFGLVEKTVRDAWERFTKTLNDSSAD